MDWCCERNLPVLPGVVTPSEIMAGLERGLAVFKFFPAEAYGGVRFMPTGIIMLIAGAALVAGLPKSFTDFSQADFFGVPLMVVVWLLIALVAWIIRRWTVFGRNVYVNIGCTPRM
jgi:predicted ABC-type sugar transport system permease subunit